MTEENEVNYLDHDGEKAVEIGEDGEITIKDPKRLLDAFDKAKKQAKKFRIERDAARTEAAEAQEKGESKYKDRLVKSEAKLALASLGIKDTERLMKFIKSDDIKLNDDGELEGLDEQIDSLKETLPELFDPKKRAGGKADLFEGNEVTPKPESTTDKLMKQLKG